MLRDHNISTIFALATFPAIKTASLKSLKSIKNQQNFMSGDLVELENVKSLSLFPYFCSYNKNSLSFPIVIAANFLMFNEMS